MLKKDSLFASASLVGTIIGAGVFGIPYVFAKSGILISAGYFLVVGAIVLLLHLALGEVVIVTQERHRLVGFAQKYLGKSTKFLASISLVFGGTGALLAYLILAGDFLSAFIPFSVEAKFLVLAFWVIVSFFVLMGLKTIAPIEFFLNLGFVLVIGLIFFFSAPSFKFNNLYLADFNYLFLPFGVILFSMIGWNAIPGIEDILEDKKNFRKIIVFSTLGCLLFYFLFGLIVAGVTGERTTEQALEGLQGLLGKKILLLGNLFGLLAVSGSFLVLANYTKNTFRYDYRLSLPLSFVLTSFPPLVLFFLGFRQFIWVIGVVGALFGMVDGLLIAFIYKKIIYGRGIEQRGLLKIPLSLLYLTIFILVLGGVTDIIYNIIRVFF